jgi:hypothetical protein
MRYASAPRTIGLLCLLLFTACTQPSVKNTVSNESLNSSSLVSIDQQESATISEPTPYSGPFKHAEWGHVGTLTIKGYAVIETAKDCPDAWRDDNCSPYQYVFFHIIDGITDALSSFIKENSGNSFMKFDAIGLGCLAKGTISAASPDGVSTMSGSTAKLILQSTEKAPITLTLVRTVEPDGGDAPHCYSHFKFVLVTR